MKGQDILLLLKLVSLARQAIGLPADAAPLADAPAAGAAHVESWQVAPANMIMQNRAPYLVAAQAAAPPAAVLAGNWHSVRSLAEATGISKSEISQALQRNYAAGLARIDRKTGLPRVHVDALLEFLLHGLRYVFPAKPGPLARGMATAWAAPVMHGVLQSAGELVPVWPDALGEHKGETIVPLFQSAALAARQDPTLYALLALCDSLRIGLARERNLARQMLEKMILEAA
jgi:hypothetical protein